MTDAGPRLYARAIVEQHVNVCFCGAGDKQRALDKVCDVLRCQFGACIAQFSIAKIASGRQVRRGLPLPRITFLQPVAMLVEHEAHCSPSLTPEDIMKMDYPALCEVLRERESFFRGAKNPPLVVLALDGIDREVMANDRGVVGALHFLSLLPYVALVATADVLRGDVFRGVFWTFVRADTFVQHPCWKLSERAIPDPACVDINADVDVVGDLAPNVPSVAAFDETEDDVMPGCLKHLSR